MDAVTEIGRIPASHQIQPECVENEQAGAGRNGTAEPVSRNQSLRRKRKIIFPCQLTTARIGNYTRLVHARMKVLTINKYYVW